ncbi:hypothetical protein [Thalassotalea profundi]|uniref:Secreted protein n=1 Tax=Thalassotalea profundi TaxID=2036687 RepID=A0ABQ3IFJ3_9GAMM|nr:hypothetical protein [Thalassotalea profundi]GHE81236.1 hypothetical protein GCM10011501_06690 [Thalassotalea profundi]
MKSLINLIILICLISLTSFTVLRTQAEDIKRNSPLILKNKNFVLIYALPQHSNGGNSRYTNNLMVPIADDFLTHEQNEGAEQQNICPSKKGNEVYELTALFNDKLQVLLSFFTPPKNQDDLKEVVEDKDNIQLVSYQ